MLGRAERPSPRWRYGAVNSCGCAAFSSDGEPGCYAYICPDNGEYAYGGQTAEAYGCKAGYACCYKVAGIISAHRMIGCPRALHHIPAE